MRTMRFRNRPTFRGLKKIAYMWSYPLTNDDRHVNIVNI